MSDLSPPDQALPFVKPQKAKQTNRSKPDKVTGVTRMLSAKEIIAWVDTLDPNDWYAEIKQNGFRAQFQSNGWYSSLGAWNSRESGFEHICDLIPPGVVLDGELMPSDGEGHEVVAHYVAACPEKLKLVAFDLLAHPSVPNLLTQVQSYRRTLLVRLAGAAQHPEIEVADAFGSDFGAVLRTALAAGREGLILKHRSKPYVPGSRANWLKAKATETVDVVITDALGKPTEWRVRPGQVGKDGVCYPEGRHSDPWIAGHVGLRYGFYDPHGNLRVVGTLGVTGPKEEMEQHIGKVARVFSFGPQFPTGAIQHPTFDGWHLDKDPLDCRWWEAEDQPLAPGVPSFGTGFADLMTGKAQEDLLDALYGD